MEEIRLIRAAEPPESLARTRPSNRPPFRIAAVQHRWHADPEEHEAALAEGVRLAAGEGAKLVCLQELTLSRYFAVDPGGPQAAGAEPEDLPGGRTFEFASRMAQEHGFHVHASLYERAEGDDGLGFNTAIVVSPKGELVARTRKLHIPITAGYYEDKYFRPGPGDSEAFPLVPLDPELHQLDHPADSQVDAVRERVHLGLPTCWDQWFPEVARAYSLEGAEVLIYPTAIGSEPDHPEFDTQPLWQHVIVGNGIANGVFMVAINRLGTEAPLTFYGSSFISDPYGRILAQAPREEPAVLVADLDLDQRRDWLELFPFLTTRRPDTYARLAEQATEVMQDGD
ncbi:MAG TPA: nitrilase-related carbon-nitrogen hydrolase [Solirubrobacterales bacterium]|nr:nitrilase-related carbon-nitrogen hydrolase [Solirubrobacterales bacterium]